MMAIRTRAARLVAALLVAVLPLASAGCFGKFQLTRKIYRFNRDISSDKWVRWISFLVLHVVFVYPGGLLIDAVFANSVEFWSGVNPFRYADGPDGERLTATLLAPGIAELRLAPPGGAARTIFVVREADSVAAYDADGRFLGRVGDVGGAPALLRAGAR